MTNILPKIIQGGMGAGVSDWRLANAVSRIGQLGVVSGTALEQILSRRLQDGDPGGHIRRALSLFPFQQMARRILDTYFIPGGKNLEEPYRRTAMHTVPNCREIEELCIAANFVEITLARENHGNATGINYLEKIQIPHLPSIYGAMLAGVAVIIMGAGLPLAIPDAINALAIHEPAVYPIHVKDGDPDTAVNLRFTPRDFWEEDTSLPPLQKPDFYPIISSELLAKMFIRRIPEGVAGFVVELPCAGGHNAPPRGKPVYTDDGQPVYGPRDTINMENISKLGIPFWLGGAYGTPEKLTEALELGAAGIQVGTAFALSRESALREDIKSKLITQSLEGTAKVYTDPKVSPAGFPFKVAMLDGTLTDSKVYKKRRRVCDLGFLRQPYLARDGKIGYRCPAESEEAFIAKGGNPEETTERKCICNALLANIGLPQILPGGGKEPCLVTLGESTSCIKHYCTMENPQYNASDVVSILLGEKPSMA